MSKKAKEYRVLMPCESDKKGVSYEAGDLVTASELGKVFTKKVINNWLDIGVLEVSKWHSAKVS